MSSSPPAFDVDAYHAWLALHPQLIGDSTWASAHEAYLATHGCDDAAARSALIAHLVEHLRVYMRQTPPPPTADIPSRLDPLHLNDATRAFLHWLDDGPRANRHGAELPVGLALVIARDADAHIDAIEPYYDAARDLAFACQQQFDALEVKRRLCHRAIAQSKARIARLRATIRHINAEERADADADASADA